ncbi:MAG: hypothetical protein WA876_01795 [Candidatus Acidiferrales bacterium]
MEHLLLLYNSDVRAESSQEPRVEVVNPFSAMDVEGILRERGWLAAQATPEMGEWMHDAAEWLGLQVALHAANEGRSALTELLALIFSYDAAKLLENRDNQAAMAREGARDVIRELANRVLEGGAIDSERFREIVTALKGIFSSHGRTIFHPLRLALAGRAGEGELDRVILLLDRAAKLPFPMSVKGTHQRMLEFCAALN